MFEKKKLLINSDICDTRNMKEEDYEAYESIAINSDLLIVSERSKGILARLPAAVNGDQVLELDEDEKIHQKVVNGSLTIGKSTVFQEAVYLIVNGAVTIEPGAEEAVKMLKRIIVNGVLLYPESMDSLLTSVSVNGVAEPYPDDCILLKRSFVMDEYFPLRAKRGGKYFAKNKVVIKNTRVDLKKLQEKEVRFLTRRLFVPEELIEEALPLFDEQTEIVAVPAGMALICDDVVLDSNLVRRNGPRLFIDGDLKLADECGDALKAVEKLIVKGKVTLKSSQEEAFSQVDADYDELELIKGRLIENKTTVQIDELLLQNSPEEVSVRNAAVVKLAETVSAELILNKLSVKNCGAVFCTKEQESAVTAVSENTGWIGGAGEKENGFWGNIAGTKLINSDHYVM